MNPSQFDSQSLSWSLCSHVTDSTLPSLSSKTIEVLDDFELAIRLGDPSLTTYLSSSNTVSRTSRALVEAVGVLTGRKELLRACWLFGKLVTSGNTGAVLKGVEGVDDGLGAMVGIVVERARDREVCESAGRAVSRLLGWKGLEGSSAEWVNVCLRKMVDTLITEVSLTRSLWALESLGSLLRQDDARTMFCERDGIATLVEILKTSNDNREEVYKTVFAIWMLSFAVSERTVEAVLTHALSSRLVKTLVNLLDDLRQQRLKVARVTLASLKNMSSGAGNPELRTQLRREMTSMGVRNVLQRMYSIMSSLWCSDIEVGSDAEVLKEVLDKEEESMSTFDKYIAEIKSGSLQWSSMHQDEGFFVINAEKFESTHRDVVRMLADMVSLKADVSDETRIIACNDLENIISVGPIARSMCLKLPRFKSNLLQLMTSAKNPNVRERALRCAQKLLMKTAH